MAERNRPHLIVPTPPEAEPFSSTRGGGSGDKPAFSGDRASHGRTLVRQFEQATDAPEEIDTEGIYVSFESFSGLELALESLDVQRAGEQPELVAVKESATGSESVQIATVYIPNGKRDYFLKRLNDYVKTVHEEKAKNAALVEGIASIRRATIRELWTDPDDEFPSNDAEQVWWEVWLRRKDGQEQERLAQFADGNQLPTSRHYLGFQDRTVMLIRATADQLALGLDSLDDLAELRRPHEVASLLTEMSATDQMEWVEELLGRLRVAGPASPVVCVLDTGVQGDHPLLTDSLAEADLHVANSDWETRPVHPHGTEMAGLALYGDLQQALSTAHVVQLDHRLESVKILPDKEQNERCLYGAITARAVDRPEIQDPSRGRVFMLAVTATNSETVKAHSPNTSTSGRPTSWSAAIDALSFGRAIDDTDPKLTYLDRDGPRRPRMFVISTGNIAPFDMNPAENHLDRSDLSPVEDPAQSWNALTVGAYSRHDDMGGASSSFAGYVPIAARGELSPFSRTSVLHGGDWPFKPEVVADGGNVAASPDNTSTDTPPNLGLLTTRMQQLGRGFFTTTNATSAATAQVAAIAASVRALYPNLRPETIRALIVHSARWTPAMRAHFDDRSKAQLANMLRRYGMGVPDLGRALRSATDALTLISESRIHPFERGGSSRVREMQLHALPWPTEQLESLGEAEVSMRVTLSYFVEPNPSSRGWTGRYVYPSHGLRFATKRADESVERFRQRINKRACGESERIQSPKTEKGWLFGTAQQQKPGSLHTDIWRGPAVDLPSKGAISVYPVAGWWQYRRGWDQSDAGVDYSLVVSIEAPGVNIDLWTPVFQRIQAAVEIPT